MHPTTSHWFVHDPLPFSNIPRESPDEELILALIEIYIIYIRIWAVKHKLEQSSVSERVRSSCPSGQQTGTS